MIKGEQEEIETKESKGRIDIKTLTDDQMSTEVDREFIRRTYDIAQSAVANGNHPFGALLVIRVRTLLNLRMPWLQPRM